MGCNFYIVEPLTVNNKSEANPYDRQNIHMGKSSAGWTFSFHAVAEMKTAKEHMAYYQYLVSVGWQIFNDYGEELTFNEFNCMVEAKKNSPHNQEREYPSNIEWGKNGWLDPEGNSFSAGEFS